MSSALEGHGNTYESGRIYARWTYKQPVTYLFIYLLNQIDNVYQLSSHYYKSLKSIHKWGLRHHAY